jgi:F0F1-type ATP synthase membrane subunit c/vacuolar-type H+-ATPase subunit K
MAGALPEDLHEDPGWRGAWKALGYGPLMGVAPQLVGRGAADPLLVTRRVFLSFPLMLVAFGVVLVFIYPMGGEAEDGDGAAMWAAAVVVVGLGSMVLARVLSRPLDTSSDAALASSYRTRMFLRIAFAETPALLGFVVTFIEPGALWVYGLGCVFAAPGFVYAAPTRRQLEQEQERLMDAGSPRSLVFALRSPPLAPER